jgi:hypothetical protein
VAAIVTLIVIALLSLLVVRAGSTALMMTGLSSDTAKFQSYSAFFGVGFTTREAELVVNHPLRRRIIRDLILIGNIGFTSALATMVAALVQDQSGWRTFTIASGIIVGIFLLLYLTRVSWVERAMDRLIQSALSKAGFVRVMDYELLLRVQHGFVVSEVDILATTPLVDRPLGETRPWDQGVIILAVKSEGKHMEGLPNRETILRVGDVATVYGEYKNIRKLFDVIDPVVEGPS